MADPKQDTTLDRDERKIIHNALGLLYAKKPYRRHYVAPAAGVTRDLCEKLADRGLLERTQPEPSGMRCFLVTEAGAAALGHKLQRD